MPWKGILPFKIHKIIFFQKKKKIGFTSKLSKGPVTIDTGICASPEPLAHGELL